MLNCYGCKNINTYKCGECVGWNRYESNTLINPVLAMNIDKEMKMLAKAGLNKIFGVENMERKTDMRIKKVHFNDPATVVLWEDGTKTIVRAGEDDIYDPEKGLAMAIAKKALGNQGNYYEVFKKWLPYDPIAKIKRDLKELEDHLKEANDTIEKLERIENEDNLEWLTPEELAEKLGCTKATIQKKCREGLHPGAVKVGGKWKIPYEG